MGFCFSSCDFKNQYSNKTRLRHAEPHIVLLAQPYWSGLLITKVGISPVASESVWWDPPFLKMLLEQARFRPQSSGLNVNITIPLGSFQQHQVAIDLKVVGLPPQVGSFSMFNGHFFLISNYCGDFFPCRINQSNHWFFWLFFSASERLNQHFLINELISFMDGSGLRSNLQ